MAANTVEKGGLRKSSGVRTSLTIPYSIKWPALEKTTYHGIKNAIGRQFPFILSQKTISKRKKKELESLSEPVTDENRIHIEQMQEKHILRNCLVVGINEVTKGLEKDQLALVLIDRSVKPTIMIDHLMVLGATRQTPTIGLHEMSQLIGPLLHYKKVAALGFKKERPSPWFDALINYITARTPEIVIPWLKPFVERAETDFESNEDESTLAQSEYAENTDVKSGLKRKLDEKLEIEPNDIQPSSKLMRLETDLTEQDGTENQESKFTTKPKTKTTIETDNHEESIEKAKEQSSNNTDTSSKSYTKKDKKKEKFLNPDFEITTVSCQAPITQTVEKGNKDKKNKKKKKKHKN